MNDEPRSLRIVGGPHPSSLRVFANGEEVRFITRVEVAPILPGGMIHARITCLAELDISALELPAVLGDAGRDDL